MQNELILSGTDEIWNPSPAETIELALARGEGQLSAGGNFVAVTSPFTGRSPEDKWMVNEPGSASQVWWGKVNRPMEPARFELLRQDVQAYLEEGTQFVRDLYAGADPAHRLRVRLIPKTPGRPCLPITCSSGRRRRAARFRA